MHFGSIRIAVRGGVEASTHFLSNMSLITPLRGKKGGVLMRFATAADDKVTASIQMPPMLLMGMKKFNASDTQNDGHVCAVCVGSDTVKAAYAGYRLQIE